MRHDSDNSTILEIKNSDKKNKESPFILKLTKTPLSTTHNQLLSQKEYISPVIEISKNALLTDWRMQILPLYPQGSLKDYAQSDTPNLSNAPNFFLNIIRTLKSLERDDVIFTDLKPSNLLKDGNKCVIADTKCLFQLNNENKIFGYSPAMAPPELLTALSKPEVPILINIEKAHSYLLGKSIYLVLTQKPDTYFEQYPKVDDFEFSDHVFSGKKGEAYKNLIKALVCEKPDERLSLD